MQEEKKGGGAMRRYIEKGLKRIKEDSQRVGAQVRQRQITTKEEGHGLRGQ